jgi:hypothetical protein
VSFCWWKVEQLLGWNGDNYIQKVEQQAKINENFGHALLSVVKYKMTDGIWQKVQILQHQYSLRTLPFLILNNIEICLINDPILLPYSIC